MEWIAVALGGAIGSALRHGTGLLSARYLGNHAILGGMTLGTIFANIMGAFLLGAFMFYFDEKQSFTKLLLTTGLCGGFTTYSTFNHQTFDLIQRGEYTTALLYIGLTLTLCLVAGALGYFAMQSL